MKKVSAIAVFLLVLVFCSCRKKKTGEHCAGPYPVHYLKAVVVQTSDMNCGKPLLNFYEDSARIVQFTGKPYADYILNTLPPAFNMLNKKLYICADPLPDAEDFPCLTMGISYPKLKLLDVKER